LLSFQLYPTKYGETDMSMGAWEWVIIFLVVLLLFGAKRIPDLARGLGQGIQEFRRASDDVKKEIEKGKKDVMDKGAANSADKGAESTTA
jgi:sec-independent protein translocase protein TatA